MSSKSQFISVRCKSALYLLETFPNCGLFKLQCSINDDFTKQSENIPRLLRSFDRHLEFFRFSSSFSLLLLTVREADRRGFYGSVSKNRTSFSCCLSTRFHSFCSQIWWHKKEWVLFENKEDFWWPANDRRFRPNIVFSIEDFETRINEHLLLNDKILSLNEANIRCEWSDFSFRIGETIARFQTSNGFQPLK